MSDSAESFPFNYLPNWKLGLAVCVPCFAVGLGVSYYYYQKTPNKGSLKPTNNADIECGKLHKSNGIEQNAIKERTKVGSFKILFT